jgi:hypothetical protein
MDPSCAQSAPAQQPPVQYAPAQYPAPQGYAPHNAPLQQQQAYPPQAQYAPYGQQQPPPHGQYPPPQGYYYPPPQGQYPPGQAPYGYAPPHGNDQYSSPPGYVAAVSPAGSPHPVPYGMPQPMPWQPAPLAVAIAQPVPQAPVSMPAPAEHCVNQHPPETWLYRQNWRRMYCFRLVGTETIEAKDCGVYQCVLPHATAPGAMCNDIIKDRGQTGQDLESHLAQYHNVTKLPERFAEPSRTWSSHILCCHEDPLAALDCLFCSCCFLDRLDTVSQVHWEKGVLPYVVNYRTGSTGCTESACDMCIAMGIMQPILCLFAPLTCCGFIVCDDDEYLQCVMTSPAVFRTKHNANIDEDQCTTKCKMLWCCPLQACQTYRELRSAGVNPGLTCCARDEPLSVKPQPTPTLGDILAANGGSSAFQNPAPGQWAPVANAAMM